MSHTEEPDATGRSWIQLLKVDAASLAVSTVATFNDAYGAAPVGFSVDGQALLSSSPISPVQTSG